jgi:hypothetical protein
MSIASSLNHGRTLYVTAWDHHTFLDILFFQWLFKLFPAGWVPVVVRVFNLAIVLAVCFLVCQAVLRVSKSRAWAFGAALAAAYLFSQPWALASHGEFYHALPVAGAFYLYFIGAPSRRRLALVGGLFAGAFFIKQTALFDIAAFVVLWGVRWMLAGRRFRVIRAEPREAGGREANEPAQSLLPETAGGARGLWNELGLIGLGAGLVVAFSAIYFLVQGSWREAVYMTFVDPVIYATGHDAASTLSKYSSAANQLFGHAAGVNGFLTVGAVLSFALLWVAVLVGRLPGKEQAFALGAGIWLALDMIGLVFIGRFYSHYLVQLIVPASIFCMSFPGWLDRSFSGARMDWAGRVLRVGGVSLAVVYFAAFPVLENRKAGTRAGRGLDRDSLEQTVAFVREHTSESEGIYIYQNWALCLYYMTSRFPPAKVFMDHQLLPENKDAPGLLRETMAGLEAKPPRLIITGSLGRSVPEIEEFIRRNYGPLTNFGTHAILERKARTE